MKPTPAAAISAHASRPDGASLPRGGGSERPIGNTRRPATTRFPVAASTVTLVIAVESTGRHASRAPYDDVTAACDTSSAHARPQAPLRRLRGRPRLPLRLHPRVVAALARPATTRGRSSSSRRTAGGRSRRRTGGARRTRPTSRASRTRKLRDARGEAEGQRPPAPRGGLARRLVRRQADARDDLAARHPALAAAPRAARRAGAPGRGRRLHRADGALPGHPRRRCAIASTSRSSSTTATCR